MNPHVHISPVHMIGTLAAFVAVFGTAHLLALSSDNRTSRAFLALGF